MAEPFSSSADKSVSAYWMADEGLIDLRCEAAAVGPIQEILQIELPRQANHFISRGNLSVYWLAPLNWLIRLPEPMEPGLVAQLKKFAEVANDDVNAGHVAITRVSDAYVGITLTGPGSGRLLSTGCPLDLNQLGAACFARTVLARAQVMVMALEHHRGYELLVDRSHADYVRQWIIEVI